MLIHFFWRVDSLRHSSAGIADAVQMTEVAQALVYLHEQRVVHGDINEVRDNQSLV
jgi:serine/threonine protein kinase